MIEQWEAEERWGPAKRFAGTITIHPTPENGLREESVALVFSYEPLIAVAFKSALVLWVRGH